MAGERGSCMATITPVFLNQTYGAYHHRDIPKEDVELTHVAPGTPCGEYMRRFWQPIALSSELKDLPKDIRILGEDLVVFRDGSGKVGLLELHCSHRGTSLEFGLVEEKGIRCCYHGWLYDVDGRILDTPGEPPDSTYKERLCHGAYPTHEFGGLVFAYMGPPEKKLPFPMYDTFNLPGYRLIAGGGHVMPCNWLQCEENGMDPAHTTFLHARSSGIQFSDGFLELPEMDFMETPLGFIYIATRRIGDNVWLRMNDAIPPNLHQINRNEEDGTMEHSFWPGATTLWTVPVDDTHSWRFSLLRVPEGEEDPPSSDGEAEQGQWPYEEQQRHPSDYQALVSQRPIAVHAMEHLADTDRGVIMYRNLVREGIRAVQRGEDPGILSNSYLKEDKIIRTYSNDTVMRLPPASTPEEDKQLLRQTGLNLAKRYLKEHLALVDEVVNPEDIDGILKKDSLR